MGKHDEDKHKDGQGGNGGKPGPMVNPRNAPQGGKHGKDGKGKK